jgi:hypothetical protein
MNTPTNISLVCMTFYRHNSLNPFISLVSLLWLIFFISSSSWLTTPVIGIEEATTPNNTDTELLQQASLEVAASSSSVNNSSTSIEIFPMLNLSTIQSHWHCQHQLGLL